MPLVTVVIIAFDDAQHLGAAIRSATRQTLRDIEIVVVDDGSTDATPDIAAAAASVDPRVSVVRLDDNSGGCSRPRNSGLRLARGDYVLFLDSDDVLPRRAAERLHRAASRSGADLACGRLVRRHHGPTRFIASNPELYLRPAVLDGVVERPRQLYDTPAVAKLYRRDFLLEHEIAFPEGLLYEDLLFTTQAYVAARRIAVVPDLVYVWNVRRGAATPSITNRRAVRNWRDRFEIHRRTDEFLRTADASRELRQAKDRKFLDVDFRLFLRELRSFPAGDRPALLDAAADYVDRIDVAAVPDLPVAVRTGAFLTSRRDLARVLAAADLAATGGVGTDLVERRGRLLWTDAYLDAPGAAEALDVTATGLGAAGFTETPFLTVVRRARQHGPELRLSGVVHDVLGRLGDDDALTGRVLVTGRVGGALWSGPAALRADPAGAAFDVSVDLHAVGRVLAAPTVGHELRLHLELRRRDQVRRTPMTARDADLPAGLLVLPTPWRWLTGNLVRLDELNGRLVLMLAALPAPVEAALGSASWLKYGTERVFARLRGSGFARG